MNYDWMVDKERDRVYVILLFEKNNNMYEVVWLEYYN